MLSAVKKRFDGLDPGRRRWAKALVGVVLGAAGGYAYYALVGCSTGGCPITSDPLVSTGYGAVVGGFVGLG